MKKNEKLYTLKLILIGLYKDEIEIKEFLKRYKFSINFISNFSIKRILFNSKKYKNLQMVYFLNFIYKIRKNFCEFKDIKEIDTSPLFLIRVDDFPHWEATTDDFRRFNEIMEKFEIHYLLGVTPNLSLERHNPNNKKFKTLDGKDIEFIKNPLIEIGMHGFNHQTNTYGKSREFVGIRNDEVLEKIENGLNIFKNFNIKPIAFIPPFDEIDNTSYKIIAKYFKIITGGPATTKYFGYKISPCYFRNSIYVPSYRPLCNRCSEILNFFKSTSIKGKIILPIVIHWANEKNNNYRDLIKLAEISKNNTIQWKNLNNFLKINNFKIIFCIGLFNFSLFYQLFLSLR